ncbi:Target of Nesh-SH3 [Takifugu flavidus]|uniref:Target of Nesh-SH3 n=1 Tax=Takifugu flavidus TaxID=433684 RepID=A0A5C6PMN5_9TELE|nr:Target of Nesh-SH3 [Takifugu flavidus]
MNVGFLEWTKKRSNFFSGKVELEKPLHLVVGPVTPSSVLLSWGDELKSSYEGNILKECLEQGHYTVRYREKSKRWNYQTCPTSDTVIDNLKPNAVYEFGVKPISKEGTGEWSKPVVHNTSNVGLTANGLLDSGHDLSSPARSEERPSKDNQVQLSASPEENRPKQMDKLPGQDKLGPPKLRDEEFPAGTARPRQERRQETTTAAPAVNQDGDSCQIQLMNPTNHSSSYLFPLTVTNYDSENSTGFSPSPASKVDSAGNKRFIAPHVIYKTNKKPEEPCSITSSLTHFPDEEANDLNVTSPPRIPPSNLTVVTVEGCPSFVILDWQKSDNETTEYQVYSTTEGPSGNVTSIVTTNQTHTAVENLKPETKYVSTGLCKNSIWTDFPFQFTSDAYSECHGRMFVKRTWYRKFVGIQLCNSLRYQIYLSDSLNGKFYNIGDLTGSGEDHCQFVDSFLDGNTGAQIPLNELPKRPGFYRAMRHEPVSFGEVGGNSRATYVGWYECGTPIPGKW